MKSAFCMPFPLPRKLVTLRLKPARWASAYLDSVPHSARHLGFFSFVVKAAGYTMHSEFVQCHMVGTAYSDASSPSQLHVEAGRALGGTSFLLLHTSNNWIFRTTDMLYNCICECPINVVLKVLLKTKIRSDGDKIQTN